ncbi:MAG TPA: metalloregulator ArsR/SmtB family transcription factor [Gemmatimonadales bacterium]|nr:metalloregulator ArsR/SmtB family transcription factor [Gemmatimonadales bacterium]
MPTTTAHDLDRVTRRLKALSDPHRLRILDRLRGGERCVCELTDVLDEGQSLLSFHLKVLKDAGLVTDRREGRWMHYRLNPDALDELEAFLASLRRRTSEARWKPVCCG